MTSCMVSVIKAFKMIKSGCETYIAHVVDTKSMIEQLVNILIAKEFPDKFLGIPPDREVEVTIELMSGTVPISIPPYRMAPIELKELKNQLQELLVKGFIRPSVSPWGAPVLFVKKKDSMMLLYIYY